MGVPCPFLEDESCSIHPERPLVCREYLVTSPAALCAGPTQEGVTPVAVPKVSMAARGLQDEGDDWFPLATADGLGADAAAQGDATDGAGVGAAVFEAAFVGEQVAAPGFVLRCAGHTAHQNALTPAPAFTLRAEARNKKWGGAVRGGTAPPRRQETGDPGRKTSLSSRAERGTFRVAFKGPSAFGLGMTTGPRRYSSSSSSSLPPSIRAAARMPALARTLFSIAWATSGCSRR